MLRKFSASFCPRKNPALMIHSLALQKEGIFLSLCYATDWCNWHFQRRRVLCTIVVPCVTDHVTRNWLTYRNSVTDYSRTVWYVSRVNSRTYCWQEKRDVFRQIVDTGGQYFNECDNDFFSWQNFYSVCGFVCGLAVKKEKKKKILRSNTKQKISDFSMRKIYDLVFVWREQRVSQFFSRNRCIISPKGLALIENRLSLIS